MSKHQTQTVANALMALNNLSTRERHIVSELLYMSVDPEIDDILGEAAYMTRDMTQKDLSRFLYKLKESAREAKDDLGNTPLAMEIALVSGVINSANQAE